MNLLELFRNQESDLVERKASTTELDRIRQAICAYSNDLPNYRTAGVIFVGQNDDLSCANRDLGDKTLLKLTQLRDDGKILPFPTMSVERKVLDGCTVAVIQVQPSQNPPVQVDNRTWIRIGPRRALATAEEERRLVEKRRWGSLPFDAQAVTTATLDDLDLKRFELELVPLLASPEARAENDRDTMQKLRAARFIDRKDVPTVSAILVFGKEPRYWFPGAYVEARRLEGSSLTGDTLDQREIGGSLIDQVLRLDEWLELNTSRPMKIGGARHEISPDYPLVALRQLARNALMHRSDEGTNAPVRITWYSDRVEISSPGGPFGQVTEKNFGEPGAADYRNPTLAGIFKSLEFVEKFGVGIQIAKRALRENGNPEPVFTISPTHVHVAIKARQ